MITNQFPDISHGGSKDAILKLGDILLKKVAISLSELYDIYSFKQSITKVFEINLV